MMDPLRISIIVSDPWDFGEAINWQPIPGQLLQTQNADHSGRALVRFDHPLTYRGEAYRFAVASPRHEGRYIAEIEAGKTVDCAFTGISDEQAESKSPLDTSKWRGGFAFIGDLTAVS